ncbi:serine hydrolase domain-containing protein [Nonomuraea jabiensis]|uniref:CubicO group peptidase (Beta-lactamase class C family) n=1 Tax=Nonomuraea jabiensis TaxID=882448 RepID=A0A7W9FY95_9ACTN|nr:serine hydrolase domain-containing protein [Nonomuraea jabiensis]MBB5773753.1 CubicO group peptidase (beta-lactamase class C family) [Nonomuraea jabiensis]
MTTTIDQHAAHGRRRRRRRALIVLAAVAAAAPLAGLLAPRGLRLGPESTGDAALARVVREAAWPSAGHHALAVALIDKGVVRTAGVGTTDAPGGRPVDDRTPFEFGSVTKTMTAMIFADMVKKGELTPRTTVGEIFPGRSFRDPSVANTSLEELAGHRSGIPSVPASVTSAAVLGSLVGGNPYGGWSARDVVDDAAASVATGRGEIAYSNLGFALLGQALAAKAGDTYDGLLRRRLLEPLGMRDTVLVSDPHSLPRGHATGHLTSGHDALPWASDGYAPTGAGGWSTSADLARFVAAVLDGTAPGTDATRPRWHLAEHDSVGYGWRTTNGVTWHDGHTAGFSSYVGLDRTSGRGVVVLGDTSAAVDYIGLRLLGKDRPSERDLLTGELPVLASTLLCLVAAARTLEIAARRPGRRLLPVPDRLKIVSMAWRAIVLLAASWTFGTWNILWPPLWPAVAALVAAGVAVAGPRWVRLPVARGPRPRLRWATTMASVLLWAAVAAVVVIAWAAR